MYQKLKRKKYNVSVWIENITKNKNKICITKKSFLFRVSFNLGFSGQ